MKSIKDVSRSKADSFSWPQKPKMADELEAGDWLIQVIKHEDKSVLVYAPAQLLFIDHYVRDAQSGKER